MNKKRIINIILLAGGITACAILPLVVHRDSVINLIILVLLYMILSSSWNILGGYTGQTNLGHAAFFGMGSLVTRYLWIGGTPFPISLLAGGIVAVLLSLVIGIPAFKLKGVYFAIGTLALAQILNVTVGNVMPEMSYNPSIADYQLIPRYYLFLGLAIITVGVTYFLVRSRAGLGMMAVREGEDAAESLGISALKYKLLALSVSAFLAGLAGGAFAYYHVSYYYNMPFAPVWTFDAMMMAYIGGTHSVIGPIVGSIFFVVLKELLVLNLGEYHLIVFGTLFILVVLFLPGGFVEIWQKLQKALKHRSSRKGLKPLAVTGRGDSPGSSSKRV
jgi:branched-chain amino acid transport system permease protein